jgi:hypothetical protein
VAQSEGTLRLRNVVAAPIQPLEGVAQSERSTFAIDPGQTAPTKHRRTSVAATGGKNLRRLHTMCCNPRANVVAGHIQLPVLQYY